MSDRASCDELRAIAPELALGIAGGDERARALGHLAECSACRRHLEELSSLADELLLLGPAQEPPAGFESRVLGQVREPRETHPPPRRRRPLIAIGAAAAAAIATAFGIWLAVRDDLEVADRYQETLAVANGEYLAAQPLSAPGGERAGTVFGYEGEPSWVLVTVDPSEHVTPGRYDVQVITPDGNRDGVRPIRITAEGGAGGGAIPIDFHEVSEVRLLGPGRGNVLRTGWSH
jgi:hypothetical protein